MQVGKGERSFRNVPAVREALVLSGQDGRGRKVSRWVEGCGPWEGCTRLGALLGGQGGPGACRGHMSWCEDGHEDLVSRVPDSPTCSFPLIPLPGRRALNSVYTQTGCTV